MGQIMHTLDFCYVYIDDFQITTPPHYKQHPRLIYELLSHHFYHHQRMHAEKPLGYFVVYDRIHPVPTMIPAANSL